MSGDRRDAALAFGVGALISAVLLVVAVVVMASTR